MIKLFGINIRPEITEIKYWVHLLLIVLIVYFLVNTFIQPMEITIKNVLQGVLFVGIADILVHTSLKLKWINTGLEKGNGDGVGLQFQ